jgi:hypothetical protein
VDVPVTVKVGTRGPEVGIGALTLDSTSVGATASWAGSYHILEMGRHYDDYVVSSRLLSLPAIPSFPRAHPYQRLTGKIRAAGVTGNIGECVGALFARRILAAAPGDVAHLQPSQPFQPVRTPDYLMRIGRLLPGPFLVPSSNPPSFPDWIPVESKARTTEAAANDAARDAIAQLAEHWRRAPASAGYGLVVTLTYRDPRELTATLVLPRDPTNFVADLRSANTPAQIRRLLVGCI